MNPDPFTTKLEGSAPITVIWLHLIHRGQNAKAYEVAWNAKTVPHLNYMREALEKRDWIVQTVIRKPLESVPANAWETDDLHLATVLACHDVYLYGYRDRRFYFAPNAQLADLVNEYRMSDDELTFKKLSKNKQNWQKKALAQQDQLINFIREQIGKASVIMIRNEKQDEAIIPANGNPQTRRVILDKLFNPDKRN